MLEILAKPTTKDLIELKAFLEAKFDVVLTDDEVLESYYSLTHLGKAIHLFIKNQEGKHAQNSS